ncbi:MAG TPA: LPS export ABC transporter ATP-binding protein [bacterium]
MNLRKIEAKSLSKFFNGRKIVDGLSISVMNGEIVGLLGPNGAGKTTTFFMIAGMYKPDGGKIFLDNKDMTDKPVFQRARYGITYLPQDTSVFKKMSVRENIQVVLEATGMNNSEIERVIKQLQDELDLKDLSYQKAYTLSGGERRRLEIARALSVSPAFLLLDEPFTGVDPIAVSEIKKIITNLKNKNIGVIISDHNVRETLSICDRAYIINDGKILAEGVPDYLLHNEKVKEHYLGTDFKI